jgi:hypothetical protein
MRTTVMSTAIIELFEAQGYTGVHGINRKFEDILPEDDMRVFFRLKDIDKRIMRLYSYRYGE